jgi:hypothetical protein
MGALLQPMEAPAVDTVTQQTAAPTPPSQSLALTHSPASTGE